MRQIRPPLTKCIMIDVGSKIEQSLEHVRSTPAAAAERIDCVVAAEATRISTIQRWIEPCLEQAMCPVDVLREGLASPGRHMPG